MIPQTIARLSKLLAFLPPRRKIMEEAMNEDAKRVLADEICRQDSAIVIMARESGPPPAIWKNTNRKREAWRGQGKRRARFPK